MNVRGYGFNSHAGVERGDTPVDQAMIWEVQEEENG